MIRTHNKLVNINYNIKTIMFLLLSLVVYSGYIFDSFFGLSTTNDYLFFCLLDFLYSFLTLQKLSLNNISTRSNSKYEHVPIIFSLETCLLQLFSSSSCSEGCCQVCSMATNLGFSPSLLSHIKVPERRDVEIT